MDRLVLAEAPGSLNDAQLTQANKGRFRVLLIKAGWGSSGYYSEEVLKRDGPRVWPAGTQMYLDHPSVSESVERPERSVRDLASVIVTDPAWHPAEQGLVAEVQVFEQWRDLLNEDFVAKVGLSIRAYGEAEHGEAEGREGPIIRSLTEGISVDWVTRAGAGGRVLELIESARAGRRTEVAEARNVGHWLESRMHLALTQLGDEMFGDGRVTREERIAMSSAVGDGLSAFAAALEAAAPQLYTRDLYDEPPPAPAEVSEAPAQPDDHPEELTVTAVAENAPGSPPADNPTTEEEGTMPELTDDQARELQESRDAALAEAEAARIAAAEAATRLARYDAAEAARPIAAAVLAESDLPSPAQGRILPAVTAADTVPLTTDNTLDEQAFRAAVREAVQGERSYLASLQEHAGVGAPRGLGAPKEETAPGVDAGAVTAALVESYKMRGLPETAARLAATGRAF